MMHYGGTAEGGDRDLTDHICDYCGEAFGTSNKLGGHVTAVHRYDQIVTDADVILDDIHRVADKLGKPPTAKKMSKHGEYSQRVCQNKSGVGMKHFVRLASLRIENYRFTDQDLLDEIDCLAEQFGRPPLSGEMNRVGEYHRWTYNDRFGG